MKFKHIKPSPIYPNSPHEESEIVILKGVSVLKYNIDDLAFINTLEVGQAFTACMMYNNKDWSDYESRIYYTNKKGEITSEYLKCKMDFAKLKSDFEKLNYCMNILNEDTLTLSDSALADLESI